MKRPGLSGAFWPTDAGEDLLRVALGLAPPSSGAWDRVQARLDLDTVSSDEYRLLPLLWKRLSDSGTTSPLLSRLRGVYRRAWYRNNLQLAEVSSIAAALGRKSIDVLVLKGGAVALLYYDDHACRPMHDVDILVRPEQARRSLDVLLDLGWSDAFGLPALAAAEWRATATLRNGWGLELDAHWDFLSTLVVPGLERPVMDAAWSTSQPLSPLPDSSGVSREVRALGSEAQLLHTIAHGARWSTESRLQWVADASLILGRVGASFDWGLLVDLANMAGRRGVMRDALAYLGAGFAEVPAEVIETLAGTRRMEQTAEWLRGRPFPKAMGGLPLLTAAYLDLRHQAPISPRAFLRAAWLLGPDQSLAAAAPSKVAAVLRRATGAG